jgi:DNA polymerase III subunit delta'
MILDWQKSQWQRFRQLLPKLPHAILLHGPRGTGKFEFARTAAGLLLCTRVQTDGQDKACGKCPGCKLYQLGNHPDFFLIQPEADAMESGEATEEAQAPGDKKKKPSTQIKIGQIREVLERIQTGTHQGGRRVILLSPAEAMNSATANALLKTLEEPPADTVLLLVSNEPDRLLPTIRSRCQDLSFGEPDPALTLNWLKQQKISDPEALLARFGGAPLLAFEAANSASAFDFRALIHRLAGGSDPFACADMILTTDPPTAVDWMQRWVADLIMLRLTGRIRYHPGFEAQLRSAGRTATPLSLLRFSRRLIELRAISHHPVNPRLFAERLALDYQDAVSR